MNFSSPGKASPAPCQGGPTRERQLLLHAHLAMHKPAFLCSRSACKHTLECTVRRHTFSGLRRADTSGRGGLRNSSCSRLLQGARRHWKKCTLAMIAVVALIW